jgi:hypothetical protein
MGLIVVLALFAVLGVPLLGMAAERRWALGMTVVAFAFAVVAFLVYARFGLGPCEGDIGVDVPAACGALPLVFPFAPLAVAVACVAAYVRRRTWPLGLGLVAGGAMVAVPALAIG